MTETGTERVEPCNVAGALRRQALAQPDAPAIHYPTGVRSGTVQYRSSSYAELEAISEAQGTVYVRVTGDGAVYRLDVALSGHDGGDGACVDADACSPGWALDDVGACSQCADGFHDGGDGACVERGACGPQRVAG